MSYDTLDEIKEAMTTAPSFDSKGYYGAFHPRKPETKKYSLWANMTTEQRIFAIDFRQLATEAPKCAGYFDNGSLCDLRFWSHVCHDSETIHV